MGEVLSKLFILLYALITVSSTYVYAQEEWKLTKDDPIEASIVSSSSDYLDNFDEYNNYGDNKYVATQIFADNGSDYATIRPWIGGVGTKASFNGCANNYNTEPKKLGVHPIKTNNSWIKFRVVCRRLSMNNSSTMIFYVPSTRSDLDKLHEEFIHSNFVSFKDTIIPAKGYTKTHTELNRIYGLN